MLKAPVRHACRDRTISYGNENEAACSPEGGVALGTFYLQLVLLVFAPLKERYLEKKSCF